MKILRTFFFLFWLCYFGVLWSRQLSITSNGMIAGSDRTWADGAAHLSYISSFLERGFLLPEHPLYKGEVFSYPPASNWLAALLVLMGLPLTVAFNVVGLGLSLLTFILLYVFYFYLTRKNILASIFAVFLFLWSGGLGFLLPLYTAVSSPGSLLRLTELPDFGIRFINTIDAELLPQRAFLLGLPVGLLLLITFWHIWIHRYPKKSWLLTCGLICGLLPAIHPHTFIVMSIFSVWAGLYVFLFDRQFFKKILCLLVPFFTLGGLLTLYQTRGLSGSFFWIKWGWLSRDFDLSWGWFWFINWGMWLPLAVVGFIRSTWKMKLFLAPFVGVFLIANVIVFQPYDWDNSKLFTWVQLVFSGVVGAWLASIWHKKSHFKKMMVIMLFCISIASGAHDSLQLLDYRTTSIQLFDHQELTLASWVRENTASHAVFLTSDTHRHFISVLAGRQIIMGYRGWMWSYGIDYGQREKDVLAMYAGGDEALALLKNYEVDYVVVGPAEKDAFYKANEAFFQNNFPIAIQNSDTAIYRVTQSEIRD